MFDLDDCELDDDMDFDIPDSDIADDSMFTNQEISEAIHDADEFFNLDSPAIIQEGGTTGVINNLPFTSEFFNIVYL